MQNTVQYISGHINNRHKISLHGTMYRPTKDVLTIRQEFNRELTIKKKKQHAPKQENRHVTI